MMKSLVTKYVRNSDTGETSSRSPRRFHQMKDSPRIGVGSRLRSLLLLASLLLGWYSSLAPYSVAENPSAVASPEGEQGGAAPSPCETPGCKAESVNLSTGFNQSTGTTYSSGQADGYWSLVASPDPSDVLPKSATAVSFWLQAFPGSSWISANAAASGLTNPDPQNPYSFETCFCTCTAATLKIAFDLSSDDTSKVYLDNSQILPNSSTANPPTDHFVLTRQASAGRHCLRIDVRNTGGVVGLDIRGTITSAQGSVFLKPDCCKESVKQCARIIKEEINCVPGNPGSYNYTFTVENLSGQPVSHVLLNPSPPLKIPPLTISPTSPIPVTFVGGFASLTVTLNNATPGDCFTLTLVHPISGPPPQAPCSDCCCSISVCPKLPDCACVQFQDETIQFGSIPGTFTYTFCIRNNTQFTVNEIYFYAPGVTIQSQSPPSSTPNHVAVSIAPGASLCVTVTITGALPGSFCFGISMHDEKLEQCCTSQHCIKLPGKNPTTERQGLGTDGDRSQGDAG